MSLESLRLPHDLDELGSVQKGAAVSDDLVGSQAPLREVVIELPAALAELPNRILQGNQISHPSEDSINCTDVLDKTAQVCNTNGMDSKTAKELLENAKTAEEIAAAQAAIVAALVARTKVIGFGKAPKGGFTESDKVQ
jgi:hypothetical protein